tara:strand:- start:331 stop:681 length:351 start_codon:yes stop_codon:yes gene_type:complete
MATHTTRKDGYLKHTNNINGFLDNLKKLHNAVHYYDREKNDYEFSDKEQIELSIQIAIADRLEKILNTLMRTEGDFIESRKRKWIYDTIKENEKYQRVKPQYPQDDEYNPDDMIEY